MGDLEKYELPADSLSTFELDQIPLIAILFQAGYLTIQDYNKTKDSYILGYPNREIKDSFAINIVASLTNNSRFTVSKHIPELKTALNTCNLELFEKTLKILFAHIPYSLHDDKESFYHAILQNICTMAGIKAQSEIFTDKGKIDLVIEAKHCIYVCEFKFNQSAEVALKQIDDRAYYERYSQIHENK